MIKLVRSSTACAPEHVGDVGVARMPAAESARPATRPIPPPLGTDHDANSQHNRSPSLYDRGRVMLDEVAESSS